MVKDDVYSLYDVCVFEGGANAELCSDLFLVLLFCLAVALWPELLDGVNGAAVLALYEANGAASTAAEDTAPLAVLFGEVGLGCVVEGCDGDGLCMGMVARRVGAGGGGRGRGGSIFALLDVVGGMWGVYDRAATDGGGGCLRI